MVLMFETSKEGCPAGIDCPLERLDGGGLWEKGSQVRRTSSRVPELRMVCAMCAHQGGVQRLVPRQRLAGRHCSQP